MTRRILWSGALALAIVVFVASWYLGILWPGQGPLSSTAGDLAGITTKNSDNTAVFFFPENTTDSTFVLEGAAEIGADGRDYKLLGIGVTDHCGTRIKTDCVSGFGYTTWPPEGVEVDAVDGHVVEPGDQKRIIVGFRFIPKNLPETNSDSVRIRGVIVRYRHGPRHFRTELGPVSRFRRPPRR